MTLSKEHYAFLNRLFPDENITFGVTRKVQGKYNVRDAHPEIEAHTRYIVTFNESMIAEALSIEQAKAAARKHQLETIAKGADLETLIDAAEGNAWRFWADKYKELAKKCDELKDQIPIWRNIESAPKDGSAILVCNKHYDKNGFLPLSVRWRTYHPNAKGEACWRDIKGHKVDYITDWMPLPTSPETEK